MNLLIPGIVTIIVTTISGYFTVKVAQASKAHAAVASNGAKVATEKSDELKDSLDLLNSMNRRLEKIERERDECREERDECREELKTTREHNEKLRKMLATSKSRSSLPRHKKS